MARSGNQAALEGARAEIGSIAAEFARAAQGIVESALHRRLEAFFESRREWFESLKPDVASALRGAAGGAIAQGVAEVGRRLADLDLWFEPRIAPGVVPRPETGWDGQLPEWISGLLRRFARAETYPPVGDLDDPGHRVWVAVLSASKPLDPVLREFGLESSTVPDLGGGHYGLQPKTAAQLDPTGTLDRLWKRYRLAYERYAALVRN